MECDPVDQPVVGVSHHAVGIAGDASEQVRRIINIASAHGLVGSPFKAAYVAAKHGLVGLTKVTALETAEDGITCSAIPVIDAARPGEKHGKAPSSSTLQMLS